MTPRTTPVSSRNQWFQRAEALKRDRTKRRRERLFFVEGVRSINAMRANGGWQVDAYLYAGGRRLSKWAQEVLAESQAATHLELAPALMAALSDKEDTSEVIALVRMPDPERALPLPSVGHPVVLLDRPSNPGNLGSIIRSVDAFAGMGIVITGHSVDPYDPQVIRASAGAFFSVPVAALEQSVEIEAWLKGAREACPGLKVAGTSAKASQDTSQCDLSGPLVLCFGNETLGLSAGLKSRCDMLARIPMAGVASSLNLACAVTAFLYEARRQGARPGDQKPE